MEKSGQLFNVVLRNSRGGYSWLSFTGTRIEPWEGSGVTTLGTIYKGIKGGGIAYSGDSFFEEPLRRKKELYGGKGRGGLNVNEAGFLVH